MNKLSLAFFTVAPVYVIIGMIWGGYMGASGDHTMMPAHAHLNLLGFAVNGVIGAFYGLAGDRASQKLGWTSFWLWNFGIVSLIPLLAYILAGHEELGPATMLGEGALILGMVCVLINVLKVRKAA